MAATPFQLDIGQLTAQERDLELLHSSAHPESGQSVAVSKRHRAYAFGRSLVVRSGSGLFKLARLTGRGSLLVARTARFAVRSVGSLLWRLGSAARTATRAVARVATRGRLGASVDTTASSHAQSTELSDVGQMTRSTRIAGRLLTVALKRAPLRTMSRVWGWINEKRLPRVLRMPILQTYARVFRCNVAEADRPLSSYASLGEFFTRTLQPNARPIDRTACLASPVDGRVVSLGPLLRAHAPNTAQAAASSSTGSAALVQAKGITYSLDEFLGTPSPPLLAQATNLHAITIYLAPGDYHRFHAPVDLLLSSRRHHRGHLFPVSAISQRLISGLFALNERVVLMGSWQPTPAASEQNTSTSSPVALTLKRTRSGRTLQQPEPHTPEPQKEKETKKPQDLFFSFSAVGATNVGSVRIHCDPVLRTNSRASLSTVARTAAPSATATPPAPSSTATLTDPSTDSKPTTPHAQSSTVTNNRKRTREAATVDDTPSTLTTTSPVTTATAPTTAAVAAAITTAASAGVRANILAASVKASLVGRAARMALPLSRLPLLGLRRVWAQTAKNAQPAYDAMDYANGGITVQRGDEIGYFSLGSTVVLVFDAPAGFVFDVASGQRVQMGQSIGHIATGN